jgi:hypothetical protein
MLQLRKQKLNQIKDNFFARLFIYLPGQTGNLKGLNLYWLEEFKKTLPLTQCIIFLNMGSYSLLQTVPNLACHDKS